MVIVACATLEKGATLDALSTCARTLAGVFERLRCRIVDNRWVEAEDFKVYDHLFEMTVLPPETITSVLGGKWQGAAEKTSLLFVNADITIHYISTKKCDTNS